MTRIPNSIYTTIVTDRAGISLTPRQADLLHFIVRYQELRGYSPDYADMIEAMGYADHARAAVHNLLSKLESRGHIQRLKFRKRAIRVIRQPKPRYRFIPARDVLTLTEVEEQRRRADRAAS